MSAAAKKLVFILSPIFAKRRVRATSFQDYGSANGLGQAAASRRCREGARRDMTAMATRIATKLEAALSPQHLNVIDESHRHQGHGGWREGGETHFRVEIVSDAFIGKSRLERHRLVNAALSQELADRVHALAIQALAPGEA
jgi:BolA protein